MNQLIILGCIPPSLSMQQSSVLSKPAPWQLSLPQIKPFREKLTSRKLANYPSTKVLNLGCSLYLCHSLPLPNHKPKPLTHVNGL